MSAGTSAGADADEDEDEDADAKGGADESADASDGVAVAVGSLARRTDESGSGENGSGHAQLDSTDSTDSSSSFGAVGAFGVFGWAVRGAWPMLDRADGFSGGFSGGTAGMSFEPRFDVTTEIKAAGYDLVVEQVSDWGARA